MKARRPRDGHQLDLTDGEWAFLHGDAPPPGCEAEFWDLEHGSFVFRVGRPSAQDLWAMLGADVLDIWAVAHPGRRPPLFWSQTSPRPFRERLGGTGTPAAAWTAYVPRWHLGVPCDWLWAGRDLPPDTANHARPDDPPVYESQAAALKRMGMLLPGECRRLTKAAYAPVRLAPP